MVIKTLFKTTIEFCAEAYNALKNDTSDNACYVKDDENNGFSLALFKKSSKYGEWALFRYNYYVINLSEELLKEWGESKEKEEQEKKALKEAEKEKLPF